MTKPNEPAFTAVAYGPHGASCCQYGLTKRELFAANALQGIYAGRAGKWDKDLDEWAAQNAVKAADTLITELNRKGGK